MQHDNQRTVGANKKVTFHFRPTVWNVPFLRNLHFHKSTIADSAIIGFHTQQVISTQHIFGLKQAIDTE